MPPRLPLRPSKAAKAILRPPTASDAQPVCFFCSLSRPASTRRPKRKALLPPRRPQSTAAATSTPAPAPAAAAEPREELETLLLDLQKHGSSHVNLSRLQLALNGLRQKPGNESIRVAVLGLSDGSDSGKTAKQLLKLLLADPLKNGEQWERELDQHNLAQPMIIRVGALEHQPPATISMTRGSLLHEVHVSSATLNGHNLELLLMETNPYATVQDGGLGAFEESVLVPTVDIPTSSTGRYTPITTPVHKAMIVAKGLMGAASLASLPLVESEAVIKAAVDMPEYKPQGDQKALPLAVVDVDTASLGLSLVRRDIGNAMEYEHMWFQSEVPKLADWLKADIMSTPNNATKPPVRRLIASLLQNASASVQREESRRLVSPSAVSETSPSTSHLQRSLADWAETAHTELQESLDLAFSSRRWRKLGWWKLFWRVDDVAMLTTDILGQRFLPASERSAIFLAGRIEEAGVAAKFPTTYTSPAPGLTTPEEDHQLAASKAGVTRWPTSIPTARAYLQTETVPALQALAQKLVLQTLSTSGLTSSLGALAYFGTLTTSLYEAGAVAALGIVWSMRRMQIKWETARAFWEGEVREEGRKAVRGVETAVTEVLKTEVGAVAAQDATNEEQELARVRELVERASQTLEKLK